MFAPILENETTFSLGLKCLLFGVASFILYGIIEAVYNVTLHPLAKIPGPLSRGMFHFGAHWDLLGGDGPFRLKTLHDKYGPVVRVSPRQISFTKDSAWQDIYALRQGKKPVPKDPELYSPEPNVAADIITANDVEHARMRRLLAHAFSESALREQESLITYYIDLLIRRLRERAGKPVDIVQWYNFTTFDIIGDLGYGESFDALKNGVQHHWIEVLFSALKSGRIFPVIKAYPILWNLTWAVLSRVPGLMKLRQTNQNYSDEKVERRLESQVDRKDFMSYILRHNDHRGMTEGEIKRLSRTLILAGSETTATLLSGLTYHLIQNAPVYQKLKDEIRGAFTNASQINFTSVQHLPYMNACISEALRIYPPAPGGLARKTPPGGSVIAGEWYPPNTSVAVHMYAASHSELNFKNPDAFVPERWLDNKEYATDKRNATWAFSLGPRNCIGQHLAMSEMRTILAHIIWNFDIELCDDSRSWIKQKVYFLWEKPPMNVIVKNRLET